MFKFKRFKTDKDNIEQILLTFEVFNTAHYVIITDDFELIYTTFSENSVLEQNNKKIKIKEIKSDVEIEALIEKSKKKRISIDFFAQEFKTKERMRLNFYFYF